MLFGDAVASQQEKLVFKDYLTTDVIERYIAEGKYTVYTPFFTLQNASALKNNKAGFIITSTDKTTNRKGLQISSKIATQITNWIYSSKTTPDAYIQEKINLLIDSLHYRDEQSILQDRLVFKVKC